MTFIEGTPDRTFSAWLGQVMPQLGVTEASGLRDVLEANGCRVSASTLKGWMDGTSEPTFDKIRAVLAALNKALPDIDVWQALDRFTSNDVTEVEIPSGPPTGQPSLDAMTSAARLPPGLS